MQVVVGTPIVGEPVVISNANAAVSPPQKRPPLERRSTTMAVLGERGWPPGLTAAIADSNEQFPVRFVIVDNSGSMQSHDGARLVKKPDGTLKSVRCTRWSELGDVVLEMSEVAMKIGSPTHFHLLNRCQHGQFFTVADAPGESCITAAGGAATLDQIKAVMSTSPTGTTPLTEAVQQVIRQIAPAADKLNAHGQKAVVVLATDGLPNDANSFLRALQELQRLPAWLVVRLCTNQDDVVDYWSDLDRQLEAPLETLDDVAGEALEVHKKNPWLTYAPSLHLARTMGLQEKLFDLLDESTLLPTQAKRVCELVLGCNELPEPEADPDGFRAELKAALAKLPPVYNPVRKSMTPWIDVKALERSFKGNSGSGCVIS